MMKNGTGVFFCSSVLVFFLVFNEPVVANSLAKQFLLNSNAAFDKGQYQKALTILKNIDIHSDLDNSDDMKLAYKIRAISYAETGFSTDAVIAIRELFFLDPNYKFDPFDTPFSVIELAEKEQALIEEKNKYLASIKTDALPELLPDIAKNNEQEKILFIERKPKAVTSLFPFGINHFLLNAPIKGSVYLSMQAVSLGVNIAAFWWKSSYLDGFGSRELKDSSSRDRFQAAQMIQYIALGGLLISYCASIIDALIRFQNSGSEI